MDVFVFYLFVDLYLMHWPDCLVPGRSNREVRMETWRALEELYDEGGGPIKCSTMCVSKHDGTCVLVPKVTSVSNHCRMVPSHRREQLPHPTSGGAEGRRQPDASRQPGRLTIRPIQTSSPSGGRTCGAGPYRWSSTRSSSRGNSSSFAADSERCSKATALSPKVKHSGIHSS